MSADSNKRPGQADLSVGSKWVFEPMSQEEIAERTRSICRRCDLPASSRGAVSQRIAQYCDYASEVHRLGSKQAKQRWKPNTGSFVVDRPLDIVQIDHTRINIMMLSNDRQYVLGRPWSTSATSRHFLAASEVLS